jgi:hypothetical protein
MTILDKIKALIEPVPDANPPEETWPDEKEPGYYDDTSVGTYQLPPTAVLDEHWSPTDDKELPGYRGVEHHGVPYDPAVNYIIPLPQDVADANEEVQKKAEAEAVQVTEETILPVIPVNVVSMPEPIGRQNRLSVNSFALVGLGVPQRIAPASHRREQLLISVLDADKVFIHTDQQAAQMNGYPVVAGKGDVELVTTDAVYAYAPVNATVYVLETYSVEVDERTV